MNPSNVTTAAPKHRTIDLTPSWEDVVSMAQRFSERGESKAAAPLFDELRRLAVAVDFAQHSRREAAMTPAVAEGWKEIRTSAESFTFGPDVP